MINQNDYLKRAVKALESIAKELKEQNKFNKDNQLYLKKNEEDNARLVKLYEAQHLGGIDVNDAVRYLESRFESREQSGDYPTPFMAGYAAAIVDFRGFEIEEEE